MVLAIVVDKLELLESLDNVEIVAEIYDDVFRASVQTIIKKGEGLKVWMSMTGPSGIGSGMRTLKTCLQFLPLSFSRLSKTSIISTKSFLDGDGMN